MRGSLERAQGSLRNGLTLEKRLLEMLGGAIEARSEGLGKGVEFIVRLALVAEASGRSSHSERKELPAPKSSLSVLIVDDSRDGAESLAMLLRIRG